MRILLYLFLLTIGTAATAQKKQLKVVVCLYDRIDFTTDFPLSEIGFVNNIADTDVYDSLTAIFRNQMNLLKSKAVDFEVLSPQESYYFSQKGKRYQMSNPSRKGIDLSGISDREYGVFMNNHQADFILFINYYSINKYRIPEDEMEAFKRRITAEELFYLEGSSNRRRPFYSQHLIDFDIFDANKNRLLSKGRYAIPRTPYEAQSLVKKGLGFSEIGKSYRQLAKKLEQEILKSAEEQRATEQ
jgi:hypothetical protein